MSLVVLSQVLAQAGGLDGTLFWASLLLVGAALARMNLLMARAARESNQVGRNATVSTP